MVGVELVVEDGGEVAEGVGLRTFEGWGGLGVLGVFAGETDAELVGVGGVDVDGVGVAGGTVDLHVLAVEGPVP